MAPHALAGNERIRGRDDRAAERAGAASAPVRSLVPGAHARAPRIALLDGLRGLFLVLMLLNHLTFSGGAALGWLNYSHLAFIESAQGFIFLSGLLVGLVYMRSFERQGLFPATRRLGWRALQLYGWHLSLVLGVLVLSRLIEGSWAAWGAWLGHLYDSGTAYAVAAAGLLYQPTFMDILPQYIVYLLISPAVLYLVATGQLWLVAALSLSAWLFVQLGTHLPLLTKAEAALRYGGVDLVLRAHFNPLAWQIVFVPGVVVGAMTVRGDFPTDRLFSAERIGWLRLALTMLGFFLVWRLAFLVGWVEPPVLERFQAFERRNEFGLVYLLSFLAALYATGWLLFAGANAPGRLAATGSRWLRAVLHHRFLVLIGRHSLPVYGFHVLLVYGLKLADAQLGGLGDPWSSLLGLGSIVALAIPALLAERLQLLRASAAATVG